MVIRKRPLTNKENRKKQKDIIEKISQDTLIVKEIRKKVDLTKYLEKHYFTYDAVFDENHDNHYIYKSVVQPLVSQAF